MSSVISPETVKSGASREAASIRADALAGRLERGVSALIALATGLTESEWQARLPKDGRKVGVVINHVATVFPLEVHLAQTVASGNAIVGVTNDDVNAMNGAHARDNDGVTKDATIALLKRNSAAAAAAIRAMSDADLDRAMSVSLYEDAPLTTQFVLEDHAVRHCYHHLAKIRRALKT